METFKTRVVVGRHKQADVKVIYDFNGLKKLKVKHDDYFKEHKYTFLKVGTEIEIDERRYKITQIDTLYYAETIDMSNPAGMSATGEVGKPTDFNFEISYWVEEI